MLSQKNFHLANTFLATASAYPHRPALRISPHCWTYDALLRRAACWAAAMQDCLANVERVGVFAYRSDTAYAGVLAALFAGATFVPLNRTFPQARTSLMANLAELDVIIVDAQSLPQLADVLVSLPKIPLILTPDTDVPVDAPGRVLYRADLTQRAAIPAPLPASEHPAYLLFTSGSTGQPKGVPVLHRNVGHFLSINSARYDIQVNDNLSQTFDPTFDLSIFDMFMAWSHGACLCVPQPMQLLAPYQFVRDAQITVWFSVPSVANVLRKRGSLTPGSLPTLRWSLFCGEALSVESATAWAQAAPNSVVENLYGPTELTIACAVHRFDLARSTGGGSGIVPLGQLYPGLDCVIIDAANQPVPRGHIGELCVTGPQKFPGYWRDPIKTAAAHVDHTDTDGLTRQYYRTGDRVRLDAAGELNFVGRTDHQLKVMGYRVELGDIECVLRQQRGVTDAVALGWPIAQDGCTGIVGFVTGNAVDTKEILARARQTLPAYMVPRRLQVLDRLPVNGNGKIDRNALRGMLS